MEDKSIYCVAPFVNLSTQNNGKIRLCCQSDVIEGLHANAQDFDRIWHGKELEEIRNKFLKNEWPEHCKKCKINEEKNLSSRREFENKRCSTISKKDFPPTALEFPWSVDLRLVTLGN